jgi:hypothetical protein
MYYIVGIVGIVVGIYIIIIYGSLPTNNQTPTHIHTPSPYAYTILY